MIDPQYRIAVLEERIRQLEMERDAALAQVAQKTERRVGSENHFRAAFDHAPVGIGILKGPQHRYILANPAFNPIVKGKGEIIGKTVAEVFPEVATQILPLLDRVYETGEPYYATDVPFSLRRDGYDEKASFTFIYAPWYGDQGTIEGIISLAHETTTRKQLEESLQQSEERLKLALEASQTGVWELSLGDQNASRTLEHDRIFGYESLLPEWTYQTFLDHVLPEDRQMVDAKLQQAVAAGSDWHFECRIRRLDGAVRWIEARGRNYPEETGHAGRMVGLVSDITKRKRAEKVLRESEEKFRAVFEQAAVGIGRVSFDDARWIDVNDAICRMLGYSSKEMYATPWPDITHPEDLDLDLIPFHRMAAGELDSYSVEKRYIHKEGHHVWARLTLSLVRDSLGRPDYEVAIVENITERKHAEEALKEAKAAAEDASRAKSEFLANMSHEIRTPMTVFMGVIQHLMQVDRNPERRHLIEMADQSAKRLRALIDDILDFSRIEARRVELEEAAFDPRTCLREATDLFALPAEEKGLQLDTRVSPDVPENVMGDSDRLCQVLINLIGNAVKFTHQGSVHVSLKRRSGFLEFAVSDTGIGIPEEKRDLLFQNFSQVDSSLRRRYGGTGLGLSISKQLVELMGGRISVSSSSEGGSVFTFVLPLKPGRQPPRSEKVQKPESTVASPTQVRILLAEDEVMIQELIRLMLSRRNCQPQIAESGREALEKWEKEDFDLVLMDVQMPEMSGMEATRAIRRKEAPGEKRTCIVGLTANAQQEIKDACLAAGMDHVMSKPIQMNELFSLIDSCITQT